MKITDPKTTIIATGGGAMLITLLVALITKRIDVATFAAAASAVGGFLTVLIGLFAADAKKIN